MELQELYKIWNDQYFGENMHEKEVINALPYLLRSAEVFVDVGASIGQYTFFGNKIMNNGKIYAIEADPLRFERLDKLCKEWEKSSTNKIFPIHAAAAESNTKVKFFITNSDRSGGFFPYSSPGKGHNWTEISVESTTLDNLFEDLDPDLIKVDVEGGEYRVLQGAKEILNRRKCKFLIEIHPWGDPTINKKAGDIFNLFANYGYDFKRIGRLWMFEKSDKPMKMFAKSMFMNIVMNNNTLRNIVKFIVKLLKK